MDYIETFNQYINNPVHYDFSFMCGVVKNKKDVGYYVGDTETTRIDGTNRVLFNKENELYKNKEVEGFNPNLLMQCEENEYLDIANQNEIEVCIGMLSMVGLFSNTKMNGFKPLPKTHQGHMVLSSCIQGFIHQIINLPTKTSLIDFYNLDFDGVFILRGLIEQGFTPNRGYYDKNQNKVLRHISDSNHTFDYIIKDKRIYEIKINLPDKRVVYIRDLMKVSGGVKLSKGVKDFTGINSDYKDNFKYSYIRKPLEFRNEDELNYLKYDTLAFNLLAYAIRVELGINTLTVGSFAYKQLRLSWEESFTRYLTSGESNGLDWIDDNKKYIDWLYLKYQSNPKVKDPVQKTWRQFKEKMLTVKFSQSTEQQLKKSYKGGHTYKNNEQYQESVLKQYLFGFSVDANSLYPTVERETEYTNVNGNRVVHYYPYGQGKEFKRDYLNVEEYVNGSLPVGFAKIRILSFSIKRFENGKHHTPMLRKSGQVGVDPKEYLITNKVNNRVFEVEGWYTIADIEAFKQHYDMTYVVERCILFKGSKHLFREFIDKWYEVKQNNIGAKRQLGKLILNSSYGKLGQSHLNKIENPILDNGILKIEVEKETDEYGESHDVEYFDSLGAHNMAMASYITSYARLKKLEVENFILEHGGHVVYGDTDSLYIICEDVAEINYLTHLLETVNLLDTNASGEIGLWKGEKIFNHYNFVATKKYIVNAVDYYSCDLKVMDDEMLINTLNENGKYSKICAGLNAKDMIKYPYTFNLCENPKEIHSLFVNGKLYTNVEENSEGIKDPHIYYDKDLTNPVIGAFITNKKRNVVGGILIEPTIYIITPKNK